MIGKLLGCGALLALLVLPGVEAAGGQKFSHPRLRAALHELLKARGEVAGASHDFGGHRDKAIRAIDDAIGSLREIVSVKGDVIPGVERKQDFYKAYKTHPHLRQALTDLREAREDLRDPKADFGKLRERAIRDVSLAIDQVELLIKYAR
jgi:hypothetical protein